MTYAGYHHRFGVAAGKAGLAGMTEHNLRHLFASTLLRNLAPITDVSEWLGHRDINITYAVYSHLLPDSWDRVRKVLESALAKTEQARLQPWQRAGEREGGQTAPEVVGDRCNVSWQEFGCNGKSGPLLDHTVVRKRFDRQPSRRAIVIFVPPNDRVPTCE